MSSSFYRCCLFCVRVSGEELNEVNIVQVSKWLQCVYKSMDEFACNDATLTQLKSLRMIPLTNGRVTSVADQTIFFPVTSPVEKRGSMSVVVVFCYCVVHVLCHAVISVSVTAQDVHSDVMGIVVTLMMMMTMMTLD